jgi:hypothetical protein
MVDLEKSAAQLLTCEHPEAYRRLGAGPAAVRAKT